MSEKRKPTWTPEPWEYSYREGAIVARDDVVIESADPIDGPRDAAMKRIVRTVNACAGIENPEAAFAAVRSVIAECTKIRDGKMVCSSMATATAVVHNLTRALEAVRL